VGAYDGRVQATLDSFLAFTSSYNASIVHNMLALMLDSPLMW
jgi:hypothetical protein